MINFQGAESSSRRPLRPRWAQDAIQLLLVIEDALAPHESTLMPRGSMEDRSVV